MSSTQPTTTSTKPTTTRPPPTTTRPQPTPNLATIATNQQMIYDTIDNYYNTNPISSWIANYKKARELDYIQQQINDKQNKISAIQNPVATGSQEIKAFKNQYGSDILNVHKIQDASTNQTFYMVFGNRGCLQPSLTDSNTSIGVAECDASIQAQHFKRKIIGEVGTPGYGISQLQIRNNADPTHPQCLNFDSSGLSVQPCDPKGISPNQNFAPLHMNVRY